MKKFIKNMVIDLLIGLAVNEVIKMCRRKNAKRS